MGLPIKKFIAATNVNKIVPDYLATGNYTPKPSVATISNAMDVGSPSNFTRILALYDQNYEAIKKDIKGFWLDDLNTRKAMQEAFRKYHYVCDPHGAIGYQSLTNLGDNEIGIFLETAHPAKFLDTVEETLGQKIDIPDALSSLVEKEKQSTIMDTSFKSFKAFLLGRK